VEVVEARPSAKPDRGVVRLRHRVVNQDGALVLEYFSARLIRTAAGVPS